MTRKMILEMCIDWEIYDDEEITLHALTDKQLDDIKRNAFNAGRELHPDKFAERKYLNYEQYKLKP